MRYVFALLLFAHGIAHLPGFLVLWKLRIFAELPYKTTLMAGHWDVGDMGARVTGLLFLAGTVTFVAASIAIGFKIPSWKSFTFCVTCLSLILTGLAWPEARMGFFVNLGLLATLWRFP